MKLFFISLLVTTDDPLIRVLFNILAKIQMTKEDFLNLGNTDPKMKKFKKLESIFIHWMLIITMMT